MYSLRISFIPLLVFDGHPEFIQNSGIKYGRANYIQIINKQVFMEFL